MRQLAIAGAVGFFVGFTAVAALGAWIIVRFAIPESAWRAVGDAGKFLIFSVLAGLGASAGCIAIVDRWHFRAGYHRCQRCNRLLRSWRVPCVCQPRAERTNPIRTSKSRHYRKHARTILFVVAAFVPVAWTVAAIAPARAKNPMAAMDVLVFHVVLCAAFAFLLEACCATLRLLQRGRRFQIRAEFVLRTLILWPLIGAVAMIIAKSV